jgi:hypothetical protein
MIYVLARSVHVLDCHTPKRRKQTMNKQDNPYAEIGHYYLPIPYYKGRVLKYEGIACPMNLQHMMAKPGMLLLDTYKGDRITADGHAPFTGL